MTEEKKISEYLEVLSSKAPVPGGGGASALAGALGNALGQMVVNLTVGKKKYAEVEEEMQKYLTDLKNMQQEFLHFSDRDAEVFAPLAECYRLPSATPEEKEHKDAGSGQFHIICPMEKYIRTSKKPTEYNKRFFKIGVSWSARASSEAAALFAPPFFSPSASFADAP